ncbi:MAG: polysaccharide deacetylase family protein [Lachnospiraceae bacterium]|nr:polysaccharide deacetylase family protein [Lachnospiraceae bacterium]
MTGRSGKSKKWTLILLITLIVGFIVIVFQIKWQQMKQENSNATEIAKTQDYSAAEKIEAAKKKLEDDPQKAEVITNINTVEKEVALCFEGTTDALVIEQILEYLDAYDMKATFFISAVDISEDRDSADGILSAGHDLESYTLYGTSHMEEFTQEELIEDFCRAQAVYEDLIGETPSLLKCNATDYTEEVMEAADACGYASVVYPSRYLNYASFSDEKMAKEYVSGVGKGSVISIKLSGYLDEIEYEETKVEEDPAKDKKPGIEFHELEEEEELSETEQLLQMVEWFLKALHEKEYETVLVRDLPSQDMGNLVLKYEQQEEKYEEEMAEVITAVHTTDRETAFTFRGLGDEKELKNLLDTLDKIGVKVTFFVTGEEIDKYREQVQQIMDAGHEIGSGGYLGKSMQEMDFAEICEDIYKNDLMLKELGIESDIFMPPYGVVTDEVRKAAAAMDKKLVTYNAAPARTEYVEKGYTGRESVNRYFSDARLVLCRGDITFFNMNVYEDEVSLSELVQAVYDLKVLPTQYGTREENILQICTVSQLLDHTWHYPAATNATYHAIKESGKMQYSWEQALAQGYIGNPYLSLEGFSGGELALIDKTGRVNTGGTNTVFLTFDDWGNEATIGKILYVLKKHHIKATFFIKTEYVVDGSSENLLRAIAEEGHDVASHTNTHMPIDVTQDQVSALQKDLVASNKVLSNVTGDTGAMTDFFRPPTLAVNKTGVNTVFNCGYGYIINADVSTGDYSAGSVEEVYDILLNGAVLDSGERMKIRDGSIVVMHINTNSIYTAQGLDRYLNYIESLPEGDPNKFHFAKLSDYLQ